MKKTTVRAKAFCNINTCKIPKLKQRKRWNQNKLMRKLQKKIKENEGDDCFLSIFNIRLNLTIALRSNNMNTQFKILFINGSPKHVLNLKFSVTWRFAPKTTAIRHSEFVKLITKQDKYDDPLTTLAKIKILYH
ncbi:hypothetical protein BpHYR1_010249 [Brachionus plicatilis]|uniref:Uncharacterized protein n=1 Tax=Brachionus plicatilis TaxID=10195 RepID=A0A3M7RBT1_BRAPC|nr:hypothetical protein BpHYR1_010249 [Brachionus plicatilis]